MSNEPPSIFRTGEMMPSSKRGTAADCAPFPVFVTPWLDVAVGAGVVGVELASTRIVLGSVVGVAVGADTSACPVVGIAVGTTRTSVGSGVGVVGGSVAVMIMA